MINRSDRPHHLGQIYSLLIASLVSWFGIQSGSSPSFGIDIYIACLIARLVSLCCIYSGSSPSFGIYIYSLLIPRLVSLCGIQSRSSPSFGIDIQLVVSQACVSVLHLSWIVPIIWGRYIAGCQLGLCPCVAFRALD